MFEDPLVITGKEQAPEFMMFLDTGATVSQVSESYLSKVNTGPLNWKKKRFDAIGGEGKLEKTAKVKNIAFSLPSQNIFIDDVEVRLEHSDCTTKICDGRIGVDSAKSKIMTIDFYNGHFDISDVDSL